MNAQNNAYFDLDAIWKDELNEVRALLDTTELIEERKWRQPCYTFMGKNVLILGRFKAYSCIAFFKGSLLSDPAGVLEQPGDNSQAVRQFRFTSIDDIRRHTSLILSYIDEAIQLERQGAKVEFRSTDKYAVPDELTQRFAQDPEYEQAFNALTPGRQRGYLLHFGSAKQSATRAARIEKHRARILLKKGMNDR